MSSTPRTRRAYLLQNYSTPEYREEFEQLPAHERQAIVGEQSPEVVDGHQLQPVETATTVRVANGETLFTDGPFVDARSDSRDALDAFNHPFADAARSLQSPTASGGSRLSPAQAAPSRQKGRGRL